MDNMQMMAPNDNWAPMLASALRAWFAKNKRRLPWREKPSPYAVWLCETMAQQTQIATLLPYYNAFLEKFPNVASLAAANLDDVLKAWEGLGYYSRARNLHKAAGLVVSEHGGRLPDNYKDLRALPGVGDYTAGAILSIAFGQRVPAVDGNVLRVFARLLKNGADIAAPATKKELRRFLEQIMPAEGPGAFTEGLMELGALICTPKNPTCGVCPVGQLCEAHACGTVSDYPFKSAKRAPKHIDKTVVIVENEEGCVLLRKRDERLLGGMWEFFSIGEKFENADIRSVMNALGLRVSDVRRLGSADHVFTHMVWHMDGVFCRVTGPETIAARTGYQFFRRGELQNLAIPSAFQYFLSFINKFEGNHV